jgi:hypothetical protein
MSSNRSKVAIRVSIDPTNPGQFFACCGLLELANRLWQGAEGWFDNGEFRLAPLEGDGGTLEELLGAVLDVELAALQPDEPTTSPLLLGGPFELRLDWWFDDRAGGSAFKTWAGQQKVVSIAGAMHHALRRSIPLGPKLFQLAESIPDPDEPKKSVAPFYFDARRAAGALNLDIGFSTDAQKIETLSFPSVEFLCLVGLQRFRPRPNDDRTFTYFTWTRLTPLEPLIAAPVACGAVSVPNSQGYSFRLLFRTKYLKGFLPATPTRGDA